MDLHYTPYANATRVDQWHLYKRMRDEAPAYYIEEYNAWALSRFDDVWQASMDKQSFTAARGTSLDALFSPNTGQPSIFLFKDPPEHAASRNLIARPYRRYSVENLEPKIRNLTRQLLLPGFRSGTLDVYALASRVALLTIADLIGLEPEAATHIRTLIDKFYQREPGIKGTTPAGYRAFDEVRAFILELIAAARGKALDRSTHIGTWLDIDATGKPMTDDELFFSIFAMIVTGSDTVPLTTAAAVYYLFQNPQQLAAALADRSLIPQAFEEAARFDQPTNILGRVVRQDVVLQGKTLRAGQVVLFLFASAGRDEREFDDADQFVIDRRPRRSLSFGTGIHFCLGQHLARLEGRIVLEELLAAVPDFHVEEKAVTRVQGEFLQGFNRVPLEFTPVTCG
jgi:cytochrome P450